MFSIFNLTFDLIHICSDYIFWTKNFDNHQNLVETSKLIIKNSIILTNNIYVPKMGLFFGYEFQDVINNHNYERIRTLYFFEKTRLWDFNEIANDTNNYFKIKKALKHGDNKIILNQYTYDYLNSIKEANYTDCNKLKLTIIASFTILNIFLHLN